MADFLHTDTNLGKLNINNYWVGMLKNGWDILDHGTLKSGANDLINQADWLNGFCI